MAGYRKVNLTNVSNIIDGTIVIVNEDMECTIFVHSSRLDLAFTKGKMVLLGEKLMRGASEYLNLANTLAPDQAPADFMLKKVPELKTYAGLINISIDFKIKNVYINGNSVDKAKAWIYIGEQIMRLAKEDRLEVFYK